MATHIAIGYGMSAKTQEAAYEACIAVKNQLNTNKTDLIMLLGCPPYIGQDVMEIVQKSLRPERLMGTSTAGIMLPDGVVTQGLALLAINSDEMSFSTAALHAAAASTNMRSAGFDLSRKLNADYKGSTRQGCIMFTDPMFQNTSLFIRGAQEVLGFSFPILGGVSSGNLETQKRCQFYQGQILTQSAVALLFGGANVRVGYSHGFKPLGKPRTITTAKNNIIYTIDNKPALQLYEEFMGHEANSLKTRVFSPHSILYPLGVFMENEGQYLLKNAIDIIEDGSIVCQGEVPSGAEVHLMIGNKDSCRQSAIDAALQIKDALGGRQAKLLLVIESVARLKILKNNTSLELQAIKEVLGYTTPIIGVYTLGELVPLISGHNIYLQNESIVIMALD